MTVFGAIVWTVLLGRLVYLTVDCIMDLWEQMKRSNRKGEESKMTVFGAIVWTVLIGGLVYLTVDCIMDLWEQMR